MSNETKKPVHAIRYGAVRVAIWENQSQNGTFYNATFERTYRDKDDQPQSAHSFGLSDLGLLQLALGEAGQWIAAQKTGQQNEQAA